MFEKVSEIKTSAAEQFSLPSAEDPRFVEFCRSKIITKDKMQQETLTSWLAHYWPLLCERFNIPFLPDNISIIRVLPQNSLNNLFSKGIDAEAGYDAMGRVICFPQKIFEETFVHELTHAVHLGYNSIGTPKFILEGIAQAGQSFVKIPDVQKKKEQIEQKAPRDKLGFAQYLLKFHNCGRLDVSDVVDGLPPITLWSVEGLRFPSGAEVYSPASELFFRYLLEAKGPEKLKELGRRFSLLKGEKQIRSAFQKVYDDDFEKLCYQSASYWCGDEIVKQAFELDQKGASYHTILEKRLGKNNIGRLYVNHVNLKPGEVSWGTGDFDVLYFWAAALDQRGQGPFFIEQKTKQVVSPRFQADSRAVVNRYPSLEEALAI